MTTENVVRLAHVRRAERVRLTPKRVADLRPRAGRYHVADADVVGLVVIVQPTGAKGYAVRGRLAGRGAPMTVKIANVASITLTDARARAKAVLAQLRLGQDPRTPKAEQRTLGELVDLYIERQRERGVITVDTIGNHLDRLFRGYRQTSVASVGKVMLAARLAEIRKRHRLPAAAEARKWGTALSRWAEADGLADLGTLPSLRPSARETAEAAERKASRWTLRRADYAAFWRTCEASPDPIFTAFLRMLAVTGLRRRECSLARWRDIDWSERSWTIPAASRKTAAEHVIYFGPLVETILRGLPGESLSQLVFPGRDDKPISGWSKRLATVSVNGRTVQCHGLRRGYRTRLAELGVRDDVAELLVGHARTGLLAAYNEAELIEERRRAQEKLEDDWAEAIR